MTQARRVDPSHVKVALPCVQQRDGFSCGPAVLVSVLAYYHADPGSLERARKKLRTTEEGTTPESLERLARASGLRVKSGEGWALSDLLRELDRGRPVIVAARAHGDGHYLACVGYDRKHLLFMDSCLEAVYGYLRRDEFVGRWWDVRANGERLERWGMACYRDRPPYTRRALPVPW